MDTPPPVILAKSAQSPQNNRDRRNCELRRVRKMLKMKDRGFELRWKCEVIR